MVGILQIMDLESCGRKRSWPILSYYPFDWRDWINSQKTSVIIGGFQAKIQTWGFLNMKHEC
jgi:hypothetical protein